ncbi:integrase catalytic domain-containing protein [Trichonephila clavata]|uniref:Integrase catalytic domain-containing protein n=1 Tax=Trichonephila clavata TaxID=2740835 RepID=A0A8X6K9L2_TRICU|nr:integrase catalytic domain-containing protein [Trichonephila clavata]
MNFFRECGIKHHVTLPHFPRSNGQIEIQPEWACYHQLRRKLRTFLLSHPGQLKPTFEVERAREALRKRQIIQNKYANKHAIVLPVLHQNAKVWFKQKMKEPWKQGTIIQVGPQPRSYIIKGEVEVFSGETDFTFDKTTLRMIVHVGQEL